MKIKLQRIQALLKKILFPLLLLLVVSVFYYPTFLQGRIPLPSDAMVGLYHPFRDVFAKEYPRGIPYKNYLITDPVRQTYIWKELSVDIYKRMELPIWNPYEMAGKPLLGNFQSGVFYPLNLIFLLSPFSTSWTIFIISQSVLCGLFMFFYLRNLRISSFSSLLGAITLSFSSFSIVWLEWGNIVHTFLWLPMILLSVDKLYESKGRHRLIWSMIYVLSVLFAFFAGYLQTFFYMFIVSTAYFFLQIKKDKKIISGFLGLNLLVLILSVVQWYPTLQFILLSARIIDQNYLTIEGWFIPIQHIVQFIAPDFFGNPATLNYWGEWNYAELGGYIGVMAIILTSFSIFVRRKIVAFFVGILLIGLVFSIDNPISRIPFQLNIPFISSSQPTRLLSVVVFSLAVLASFGSEFIFSVKRKITLFTPLLVWVGAISFLWFAVAIKLGSIFNTNDSIIVAKRNLMLPTVLVTASVILILCLALIKNKTARKVLMLLILFLLSFDLLRYAWKFTPFTTLGYLFPDSQIINYIKKDAGIYRVGTTDQKIMTPNFFTHYKIQTLEGYDPLYIKSYGEFIASMERDKPDISSPFGFNRIITPHNYNSPFMDFLNVKYVLSLNEISSEEFIKVMEEGETKLYQNIEVSPRAFFVENILLGEDDKSVIGKVHAVNLADTAVLYSSNAPSNSHFRSGTVNIKSYSENKIIMQTENSGEGFLVVSDVYYPSWGVMIDGVKGHIYRTNYAFRGVVVPAGKHTVEFSVKLF